MKTLVRSVPETQPLTAAEALDNLRTMVALNIRACNEVRGQVDPTATAYWDGLTDAFERVLARVELLRAGQP